MIDIHAGEQITSKHRYIRAVSTVKAGKSGRYQGRPAALPVCHASDHVRSSVPTDRRDLINKCTLLLAELNTT